MRGTIPSADKCRQLSRLSRFGLKEGTGPVRRGAVARAGAHGTAAAQHFLAAMQRKGRDHRWTYVGFTVYAAPERQSRV